MRIKEAVLVLVAMGLLAILLAVWRFGSPFAANARETLTLQLSWRAQAESGGFVQAVVNHYYEECGVDVVLRQGGAGVDPSQLLVAGAVDATLVPQNDGVLRMNAAGFPARAIFASLQHTPAALDVHPDSGITSVEQMHGHPIMISASSRTSWWPYLKQKYGFGDDQVRTFGGQWGAFIADKSAVTQDMISNGPYLIAQQAGIKVRSILLTDIGYDPYGGILVVPQRLIDRKPETVRCLVEGSRRGWVDFMRDPRPGFAEIRRMTPDVSQGLLAYAFAVMKQHHIVETPDTDRLGLGAMTDARWKAHFDTLVATGLLPAATDYRSAYTTAFLDQPSAAAKAAPASGVTH